MIKLVFLPNNALANQDIFGILKQAFVEEIARKLNFLMVKQDQLRNHAIALIPTNGNKTRMPLNQLALQDVTASTILLGQLIPLVVVLRNSLGMELSAISNAHRLQMP